MSASQDSSRSKPGAPAERSQPARPAEDAPLRQAARDLISDVEALLIDPAKVDAATARGHLAEAKRILTQAGAEPPSGMSIPPPAEGPGEKKIQEDLQRAML